MKFEKFALARLPWGLCVPPGAVCWRGKASIGVY